MDGYSYILGALYHVRGGFSRLQHFMRALPFDAKKLPYDRTAVRNAIYEAQRQLTAVDGRVTYSVAKNMAIANELAAVDEVLQRSDVAESLNERSDMAPILRQRFEQAAEVLQEFGIDADAANVFVVDQFPSPYQEREWAALAADAGDEEAYGITPGVYFRRSGLRPFYSEFLMCHEIIHVVAGAQTPELLGRGLEEGIAEVLGGIHISRRLLGRDLTSNIFVYNRLNDDYHPLWEQYLDFTRAAALIAYARGIDGVAALVREGRYAIKEKEKALIGNDLEWLGDRSAELADEDRNLINYLCMAYPRAIVVSPLARHLMAFISPGGSVREILSSANVDYVNGLSAMEELEQGFSMIGMREDKSVVIWSDCDLYHGVARYGLAE